MMDVIECLLFCCSEEMRRWFVNHETELLKARFITFTKDRERFFKDNKEDFDFKSVRLSDIPDTDLAEVREWVW